MLDRGRQSTEQALNFINEDGQVVFDCMPDKPFVDNVIPVNEDVSESYNPTMFRYLCDQIIIDVLYSVEGGAASSAL